MGNAISGPIATLLGGALGALIAGVFLLIQIKKNGQLLRAIEEQKAQSQTDLEVFKSEIALMQARAHRFDQQGYQFQSDRITPFFDALNRSIIKSYPAIIGLQVFSRLRGHLPSLVAKSSKTVGEWSDASREMSDHRVGVLLAMPSSMIEPFLAKLEKFVGLQKEIIELRSSFLTNSATLEEVSVCHAAYVRLGYVLLVETRAAVETDMSTERSTGPSELIRRAEEIAGPLERTSVVAVPYGAPARHSWLAIWEINGGILSYEGIASFDEFEETFHGVAKCMTNLDISLGTKLLRVGEDERTYALDVTFADTAALEAFRLTILPAVKLQSKSLWLGYLSPIEIFSA